MSDDAPFPPSKPLSGIDTRVPHSARIWNYWLGGKDNYQVDREAGDQYREVFPGIVDIARTSRHFLGRAVRYLAGEMGVRQFLDVGAGLPTVDNTHEIAQRVAPESRVVYVDNDPLVLTHARALLTTSPGGVTDFVDAELRDPETILSEAARTLDLDRPVALILCGVLGHVSDDEEARSIVARLMAGLPSGSYLVSCDGSDTDEAANAAQQGYNESGAVPYHLRSPERLAGFFDGLEPVEPAVGPVQEWRPEVAPLDSDRVIPQYGGVARKP